LGYLRFLIVYILLFLALRSSHGEDATFRITLLAHLFKGNPPAFTRKACVKPEMKEFVVIPAVFEIDANGKKKCVSLEAGSTKITPAVFEDRTYRLLFDSCLTEEDCAEKLRTLAEKKSRVEIVGEETTDGIKVRELNEVK
jgi:hypothetical protein